MEADQIEQEGNLYTPTVKFIKKKLIFPLFVRN
jgi:hypothetical protein